MTKHTDKSRRASTSASKSVGRPTQRSGGRSPHRSVVVRVRLPVEVYGVLRESVPNVSGFLRGLIYEALERLPTWLGFEELRLEVEVARLSEELERLQRWGSLLLEHGSYAKAYLQELKGQGGVVVDRRPFYVEAGRRYRPPAKLEEIVTVEELVELREKLSVELNNLLRQLIELKKARYGHLGDDKLEGGEKRSECRS